MIKDPVCGMVVDAGPAVERAEYRGREFLFCSRSCREQFQEAPEAFIAIHPDTSVKCRACGAPVRQPVFMEGNGPYCCERCSFRDTYLGRALDHTETVFLSTIEALVAAIDAREHEVGAHSFRVAQFTVIIARQMGIDGRDLVDLYFGALLHDLGKIGIPDDILLKEGPLTEEERRVMDSHPEIGRKIIGHIEFLAPASEIVHSHHEHFDGSGYPRGLAGDDIVLGARIFAFCDILDALTSERSYKPALSYAASREIIAGEVGRILDPMILPFFCRAEEEMKKYLSTILI